MEQMGLRNFIVVDFTTKEAGPIASEYLGFLGMQVIRVDHPSIKDQKKSDEYYYVANNLNKTCITIDYETKDGQKQLFELLSKADVLIENRAFGFMESLGCNYDEVKKVNDRIVYCSIKPYTKNSPWANAAWNPTTVDAMGGSTYLTGYVGGIPTEPGPQLSDLSTCGYAATGILAALYQRENTGKGQFIEASMQDAIVAHARSAYEKFTLNGVVTRVGNNFPTLPDMVPMSLFKTKGEGPEDWAMIGCLGDKMVETLFDAMEMPELKTDPRFIDFPSRLEHKDELLEIIQKWAINYNKDDLMEFLLGKNRLVCASVCTTSDVIHSDDLKKIGFVHTIHDDKLGDMNLPGFPSVFHGVDPVEITAPKACDAKEVIDALPKQAKVDAKDYAQSDLVDLFSGLTVVECTLAEAGPVCGQTLAMLGANVIHIERPADEPDHRFVGHCVRQNNKRTITLDTKTEEGKQILSDLIKNADVFLENFAPGAFERMGFSYEEVVKINPEIVYCSIKGFAKGTRFEKCITYDPVACCSGGGTFLSGLEDGDPMLCGINVGDSGSAIIAGYALSGAILRKKVTGKGCFVECPMQNAVVSNSRESFAEYYATGGHVRRAGNSYRGVEPTAPWNLYPCQGNDVTGNYVVICCRADHPEDFEKLCHAMNRPDLLENPDYKTAELRYKNRHNLDYEVSKWTVTLPKRKLIQKLAVELQIPAGAVLGPGDMIRGKTKTDGKSCLRWMEFTSEYCKDKRGKKLDGTFMPTLPLRFENKDIKPTEPGMYNSCNEEIYEGLLGLSKETLDELKEKKII